MMVEAEKTWSAKGIVFIAVSLDDNKTFLAQYHVGFPVWTGASTDDLDRLHLGQAAPDTAFLEENGVIVARVLGEIRRGELDQRLAWLTSDRTSPPPPALIKHL